MPLRRLAQTTVVAACIFLSGTEPAPCIDTARDVTSTADAQNLADDLNCTGEGEFNVIWYGNVAISQTFYVSDGISLNVTGKNSSILSLDGDEGRGTIVGDGITSETGIFFVSGSSTLTLSNLVLQGGSSTTEYGSGAVEAQGSADANQTVNLIDCLFTNNTGISSGAIVARYSVVNMYGTTSFIGNNGFDTGAIVCLWTRINLYGASMFLGNNGTTAGAVYGGECDIAFRASATFANNTSGLSGGAFLFWSSDIEFGAYTTFTNNTSLFGGAVYVFESDIKFNESVTFANNTSGDEGGACFVLDSDMTFNESATFTNNTSGKDGGAFYVSGSGITFYESATFTNNTSGLNGGAILVTNSSMTVGGSTTFTNNTALLNGGAISAFETILAIDGSAFTGNSAFDNGGALNVEFSSLSITGATNFTKNVASRSGGGFYSTDSDTIISGKVSFVENIAFTDGGAISIDVGGEVSVEGLTFVLNEAAAGGASSIVATDQGLFRDINFRSCTFDKNTATEGGALYLLNSAQTVVVEESVFRSNTAVSSGGAIYNTGELALDGTLFTANQAGFQGLAVNSLGEFSFANNTTFERNARYCPLGEYGYDENLENDACRAEVVCSRCSNGCDDDILEGVTFSSNSAVPAADCEVLPVGTDVSGAGATLATLNLAEGYYRTSSESHIVLECYQKDACTGGIDADNYCAAGYKGPYCAVCKDTYAPGIAHSCHKCSGRSLGYAVGLVLLTLMVILGGLAVAVAYLVALVRVGGSAEEEQEAPRGCWKWRLGSCHSFLRKVFPVTSMKVIVVVWQILTQFGAIAGEVYPDEYQAFLSNLSPINLDIGLILSFSCVADTDFYDRLLLSTMMPLVVFAVLGGTYAIAKKRNMGNVLALRAVQHKHIAAALFVTFFIYSSVSFTVFQTFVCDSLDDGVDYLRADYSISCWSDLHLKYVGYASVMVFVYPIGIPAAFICWLIRNRYELAKPGRETVVQLQPFSGLWAAYRPSCFYYEVVEYCRRVSLTGIAVFIFPGSAAQIAVVLLMSVVFSFISETLQPFSHNVEMWLYRWGNGIVMSSMYVALLLKVDVSEEDPSVERAFAGVIIAANVFMIVSVLIQSALLVLDWRVDNNVVEVVGPHVSHARTSSVRIIPDVGDAEEAELHAADDQEKRTESPAS